MVLEKFSEMKMPVLTSSSVTMDKMKIPEFKMPEIPFPDLTDTQRTLLKVGVAAVIGSYAIPAAFTAVGFA